MRQASVFAEGFTFCECPRWHDGRLWVSDFYLKQVLNVDAEGKVESFVDVPNQSAGTGWLPDGRLLVNSMLDRKVMRLDPDGLVEHADLSDIATWHLNDMVVDGQGRAYVGNFGFDLNAYAQKHGREASMTDPNLVTAALALVTPDGAARAVADGLRFPNGTIITPDGGTLVVAETMGSRLTAFDIATDGSLSNRRVWAELGGFPPDGICLDAEGAIWVANPIATECLRIAEGGAVLDRVETHEPCYACALGGPELTTLFLTTNARGEPRRGQIEVVEVDVPGVGSP